jgi:hypothetical protein
LRLLFVGEGGRKVVSGDGNKGTRFRGEGSMWWLMKLDGVRT